MTQHVAGRRPPSALEMLEEILPRLDQVLGAMAHDRANTAEAIAALRGVHNEMLFAGTVQLLGIPLQWAQDFVVPFASVLVADTQGAGPLVISTDASGATLGPGTVTIPINGFVTLPLVGRHLNITGTVAQKPVFVACYTKRQPPTFGVA